MECSASILMYLNVKVWNKNRRAKFLCRAGGKIFVYLSFPRKDLEASVRSGKKKEGAGSKTEVSGEMKKAVCPSPRPSPCQPQTSGEVTSHARGSGFFGGHLRGGRVSLVIYREVGTQLA